MAGENEIPEIRQQGTRIEYVREGLVEWYRNRPEGLEHGYIVERKRDGLKRGLDGRLLIQVDVGGLKVEGHGSGDLAFVNEAGEPVLGYGKLQVWDARGVVLESRMLPTGSGFELVVDDLGAVYPILIDPLIVSLEAKLGPRVTGSGSNGDRFGGAVSLDGDTVLVGVPGDDDVNAGGDLRVDSGSAYVFVRSGANWVEQAKLTGSGLAPGDAFGLSVSLEGDTALVSAHQDDEAGSNAGSVYVFVRSGATWVEQAKLIASDAAAADEFGIRVSLSGDTALIGAHRDDELGVDSGSAYVFVTSGTTWTEQAKLNAPDGMSGDRFGGWVSVSNDTALVGAWLDSGTYAQSGSAYVFVRNATTWTQQAKLTASDAAFGDRFGITLAVDGDSAVIGAYHDDDGGSESGSAYVFVRSGSTWTQQAKLTASDAGAGDNFGVQVGLSGDTAAVGASKYDGAGNGSGAAYVFVRVGTSWSEQATLIPGDAAAGDNLGHSLSVDGDTLLVGAFGKDSASEDAGGAYVFERNGTSWSEQAKLTAGDSAAGDAFGYAVSIFGDTVLVGAGGDNDHGDDSGSAYVFVRSGTSWSPQAKLTAADGADSDGFGLSVSLSGDVALIGAPGDDNSTGSAYVFVRSGTTWSEQAKLTASDASNGDGFGNSVSVHGETALVGAQANSDAGSNSGSAYVFVRSGTIWSEQAKLTASDAAQYDNFGVSVSLNSDTAVVGAFGDDSSAGSAYVFVRSGSSWSEQAKLSASDAAGNDRFGWSVHVDADTAIIGAYRDDDGGFDSGSAYVFVRSGSSWSEQAKLTALDAAFGDNFGESVCVDGNMALVGAPGNDDAGSNSGSAYVFVRSGSNWGEQVKLTAYDATASDLFGRSTSLANGTALVGASSDDRVDKYGAHTIDQGSVYVFRLFPIGSDRDGDGASDDFEVANGFDPDNPDDLALQDADQDGIVDLVEIFQGTDRSLVESHEGVVIQADLSAKDSVVVQYRRSTDGHGIIALPRWSGDLGNWVVSGGAWEGMRVEFSEDVVEAGDGYEIVELTAHVLVGSANSLFVRLDVVPTQ